MNKIISTIGHMDLVLCAISNNTIFGKILIGLLASVVGFLTPIKYLLAICFIATLADMAFGIKVAMKLNRKIESNKNWTGTIKKMIDEFVIISLAHGLEWAILGSGEAFYLTKGVTTIITLTEMWSIIENLNTIDPNGPWKILGKFLRVKGELYTGIHFEDEHNGNHNVDNKPLEESL